MQKRKILFLITKGNWGGAQKYVYDLATGLPHEMYDVVVVIGTGGLLLDKLREKNIHTIQTQELERDVAMFSSVYSVLNPFTIFKSIAREIRVLRELIRIIKTERPHVLHVSSSKAAGLGMFACRLFVKNVKGIFTVHGWGFLEDRPVLIRKLLSLLSWLTAALAQRVILVSENDLQKSKWMPFVQRKLTVIHNGISAPDFLDRDNARTALLSHINGAPESGVTWCTTVSELTQNKGLSYLIEACAELNKSGIDFVYLIIGDGEKRETLMKQIKKHNLSERVFLTGFIKNASKYIKAFDILSLTSVKEGLPYTLIEAGHAGITVVASNVGGIPEIVSDMQSGMLVKPKNSKEIAEALRYLIDNKEAGKSFGEKLRQSVLSNFSIETMRKKTYTEYK